MSNVKKVRDAHGFLHKQARPRVVVVVVVVRGVLGVHVSGVGLKSLRCTVHSDQYITAPHEALTASCLYRYNSRYIKYLHFDLVAYPYFLNIDAAAGA